MGVLIDILIIYFLFSGFLFIVNYYVQLIKSKESYTRNEIINPLPIFNILVQNIADKYPFIQFIGTIAIFSLIGIIIPFGIDHWITRSAFLPVLFFIIFPFLVKYFEDRQVSEYANYSDLIQNLFIKFNEIVFYSYSCGTAATIIYKWGAERELSSIFFLSNIVVISILISISTQKNINKGK